MNKFIVVQGPGSTGKTSAIRTAVRKLGIDFSGSPVGDIFCVTRVRVGTRNALLGVCSSGDTAAKIRENFDFLKFHDLDFVILACRTGETTMSLIRAFANLMEAELAVVETSKRNTPAAITTHERKTADSIVREVRG